MDYHIYLAYLATVGVFFATPPGPSQILMISNSLRHGVKRSMATAAGDLSANCLQMIAAGFGLAFLISDSAETMSIIKWAGVTYLVFIGIRTFRAPAPDLGRQNVAFASLKRLFLQGFITSASNPKAVLFFAALFPQFIDARQPIWPQLLILGATYILVDGILLFVWGACAERLLGRLREKGRLLNRISGGMMIGAAGMLAGKSLDVR